MLELGVRMRPQARTAAGVQIGVAVHHQQAGPAQTIQDRAAAGAHAGRTRPAGGWHLGYYCDAYGQDV